MTEMSGSRLIEKIKDVYTDILVISISSHNENDIIINVMKMGVFDYMVKPVRKDELILKVPWQWMLHF